MNREDFAEAVLGVVERIPESHVMTYGDVAFALGSRAARQVGQVMAHYGHASPWWRVVPVSGDPPKGHEVSAREHYLTEATPVKVADTQAGYRIVMSRARLPFDHEIYEGALILHLAADEENPDD